MTSVWNTVISERDRFPLGKAAKAVTFVPSYLHFGAFVRSYAPKKPLLSTRAKEVFLLYHKIEYGIIISTTRDLRRNNMNENKNNKNSKKGNNSSGLAIGMCIGISIGTAIGAATHNIGLWMPIGLSAGLCLGIVLGHNSKDDNEDGTDDKQ